MQTGGVIGVPDVHARAGTHRLQALEDLDVLGCIGRNWILQNGFLRALTLIAAHRGCGHRMKKLYHAERGFCEGGSLEYSRI
jgi:hypothetical protein